MRCEYMNQAAGTLSNAPCRAWRVYTNIQKLVVSLLQVPSADVAQPMPSAFHAMPVHVITHVTSIASSTTT